MSILCNIFFIIIGWIVVHILSEDRDIAKEWRAISRNTVDLVNKIEVKAIKYHTSKYRNLDLERDLELKINLLDSYITMLDKNGISIEKDISEFRIAITYKNFHTEKFEQKDFYSEMTQNISMKAEQLRLILLNAEYQTVLKKISKYLANIKNIVKYKLLEKIHR